MDAYSQNNLNREEDSTDARWGSSMTPGSFCRLALPIAIASVLLGWFLGLIPSWPVLLVLLAGTFGCVSLLALRRRVASIAAAFVAIGLTAWLSAPSVDIRAASAHDSVSGRYLGMQAERHVPRNIAIATDRSGPPMILRAFLYHVKSHQVQELNSITGTFTSRRPRWQRPRTEIAIARGDVTNASSGKTSLGIAGMRGGAGSIAEITNDVDPEVSSTLTGRLFPGKPCILYVEGDGGFHVDRRMSIEEFAKSNSGNYLVVTIETELLACRVRTIFGCEGLLGNF